MNPGYTSTPRIQKLKLMRSGTKVTPAECTPTCNRRNSNPTKLRTKSPLFQSTSTLKLQNSNSMAFRTKLTPIQVPVIAKNQNSFYERST